jgi:hypothetical protein
MEAKRIINVTTMMRAPVGTATAGGLRGG